MLETVLQTIGNYLASAGIKLAVSLAVFVVCWRLISVVSKKMKKAKLFSRMEESAKGFLLSFISIVLRLVLILTVASILGVPMTSIVALVGSCGLAVGLSLQGSLANFAGGLMLLIFHPFKVGDTIEAAGVSGKVKSIAILYTTLLTGDNKTITVPNGALSNATITNFSLESTRRVDFTFTAAGGTEISRVKKILEVLASQHPLVLRDPATLIRYSGLNENGALTFTVRAWCKSEHYGELGFDLEEKVREAFDKVGIGIPCPQLKVRVDGAKE